MTLEKKLKKVHRELLTTIQKLEIEESKLNRQIVGMYCGFFVVLSVLIIIKLR